MLIGFLLCCAAIVYVTGGYPLLLRWKAARRALPVAKRPKLKSVSILIAVHNGERFLAEKLDSVVGLDYPRELIEVIVLSDGSTDRTTEVARRYAERGVRSSNSRAAASPPR